VPPREPPDDDRVRGDHAPLRDDGADRGARDAPPEAVDEEPVEEGVRGEAEAGDPQWRHGVLHASQETGRGEHDEHRRKAPHRDAEVDLGLLGDLRRRAEQADEQRRRDVADEREHRPDAEREPDAVDADRHRTRRVAGAEPARDGGRRRIGEEHHEPDDRLQHGRRDAEPGERLDAEMADERRVHDEEQRLGDQGAERRHREPQDVAVQGVGRHPSSLGGGADAGAQHPVHHNVVTSGDQGPPESCPGFGRLPWNA